MTRAGNGKPIGRIVPVEQSTTAQIDALSQAGLIAWNKQKLQPLAPVAKARGKRTVASLVVENRA